LVTIISTLLFLANGYPLYLAITVCISSCLHMAFRLKLTSMLL